jgi:hypothetical protein
VPRRHYGIEPQPDGGRTPSGLSTSNTALVSPYTDERPLRKKCGSAHTILVRRDGFLQQTEQHEHRSFAP